MAKRTRKDTVSLPAVAQLTPKQQKFVYEKASGKDNATAILDAGYNAANKISAQTMAVELLEKPTVRLAIADIIADDYPDLKKIATNALQRILKGTTTETIACVCPRCSEAFSQEIEARSVKDADTLKAIDLLSKICGEYAATKSAKVIAHIEKYKLPSE